MSTRPTLLLVVPVAWAPLWMPWFEGAPFDVLLHGRDAYEPKAIDYALSFRPPSAC